MAHDVFLSYSSSDKTIADGACAVMEAAGVRCWMAPRDIISGTDWSESIIDAITGSAVLVLVFSARSNASPQVKREIERAVNRGIPVIPFRIEDVPLSKHMQYFISTPHWLDAMHPPLEAHLQRLTTTVKLLLNAPVSESGRAFLRGAPSPLPKQAAAPTTPLRVALPPEIERFERLYLDRVGRIFRIGPDLGPADLPEPGLAALAVTAIVAVLGVLAGGQGLLDALFASPTNMISGFFTIYPGLRFANIVGSALGLAGSVGLLVGAHWMLAGRQDGARVAWCAARFLSLNTAIWLGLALLAIMMPAYPTPGYTGMIVGGVMRTAVMAWLQLGAVLALLKYGTRMLDRGPASPAA